MQRDELTRYLDDLLGAARFRDYCPNGLQVEGRSEVRRIVTGVTVSQALIDTALARGADALLVHHGWFWRGDEGRVTGFRRQRLKAILSNDLNLYAYHLPLDAHPELGNNAQLAAQLGWLAEGRFGEQDIGWFGRLPQAQDLDDLAARLAATLQRPPLAIAGDGRPLQRIAWCTGGAQSYFEQAIALGVDAYVSGEISEATTHLARESGVAYFACGHHATERYGVAALARHLAAQGLDAEFVDIDNPA